MGERLLKAFGIVLLGTIVWTFAKYVSGGRLGAIPTVIIVGPFLYWANRALHSKPPSEADLEKNQAAEIERRLEMAATNQKLSAEAREEAQRRLDDLRAPRSP